MKISVITPSFNQGKYIDRAINSVRAEACHTLIQHIVLDNCSTDETTVLLDAYLKSPGAIDLDVRIRPDSGQTASINEGFLGASGDVVCWLNTDEWYEPGALRTVAAFFERNPEIDVAFGGSRFFDSDGRLLRSKHESFHSRSMLIYYGCYLPSCATFVRRRVLDAGVLLDPEYRVAMDFDWYLRIADAGYRFAPIRQLLAGFTWHDSNISTVFDDRRRLEVRQLQDRHSGLYGPDWLRGAAYLFGRWAWKGLRFIPNKVLAPLLVRDAATTTMSTRPQLLSEQAPGKK